MHETMLHQHSPIGAIGGIVSEMDNSSMIKTGLEQLQQAAELYVQQKKSNFIDPTHEGTLLTNPNSAYFSPFKSAINLLASWITSLDGNLISNDICIELMKITNGNGHIIIADLFDGLITGQQLTGNVENVKNLSMLRHFLFSIRLLMELNK